MRSIRYLRGTIIAPALARVAAVPGMAAFASEGAIDLVLGTGAVESGYRDIRQHPTGPAIGWWQIEPATHDDIWDRFLAHRPPLRAAVQALLIPDMPRHDQLAANAYYGAVMARLVYWRSPLPVPPQGNVLAAAALWKQVYNTPLGAGTPAKYAQAWNAIIANRL
ncbi:MAG: hypothetical protein RLY86_680 [Pseudomonadota bacterium]